MTIAHDNRVKALPNADGTEDTRYPNGDKPVSGTALTVNAAAYAALIGSLQSVAVNVHLSFNVRSVFSGTDAATAVLSLVTLSGADAAAAGWAVSGDFLTYTGTVASAGGVLEVIATPAHGSAVVCPATAWSSADPSSDSMAPTAPTGVALVPVTNGLQLSWDTSGDGYDGATAGGGVDFYNLYKNSVAPANKLSPPSPIASPTPGAMPRLTATNIGGVSPAPVVSQNKQTWTVTTAGTGFHGVAADQCEFIGAPLSGDQSITLSVPVFTSANQFSPVGIMVRESRAPNSVFIAWYWQLGTLGLQGKSRDATGAISANFLAITPLTGPGRVRLIRSGNTWTCLYSQDGGPWKVAGTKTLAMAQVCEWGAVAASQTASAPFTATVVDINLTGGGSVSTQVSTAVALTLGITAVDKAGNESGPSIFVAGSPLSSGGGAGQIVISTGIRVRIGGYGSMGSLAGIKAVTDTLWAPGGLDVNNRLKGICISATMAQLEGPALGQYDGFGAENGFTKIRALINLLKSYPVPRDLTIEINGGGNGWGVQTNPAFISSFCPAYMNNATYGGGESHLPGTSRPFMCIWNQNVANRFIALFAAYYQQFGPDTPTGGIYRWDPYQEVSVDNAAAGYSPGALLAVWPSLMAGLRAAAPQSLIIIKPTFINPSDGSSYGTILNEAKNNRISMANEDCADNRSDWGTKAYLGQWASTPIDHTKANGGNPDWDFHCNIDPAELFQATDSTKYNNAVPPATYGSGRIYDGSPTFPGIWTRVNTLRAGHVDIYIDAYGGPNCNRRVASGSAPPNPTPGPGAGLTSSRPNIIDVLTGNTNFPGIVANGCAMPWTVRPPGY